MDKDIGEYHIYKRVNLTDSGSIFAVWKKCGTDKKAYILKTLEEDMVTDNNIKILQNEINILDELNQGSGCKYIPQLYAADRFNYPKEKNSTKARPYYVIDYYSRGNLYSYVSKIKKLREKKELQELQEKHIKFIFKEILLGVQYCHSKNIYHLDLKPANIVFDKNFVPIIIDFGLSKKILNSKSINGNSGTDEYKCPEMWDNLDYFGEKADIFSLGSILFNLLTGRSGFIYSKKSDSFYKHIFSNKIKEYWDSIDYLIKFKLSKEFQELYIKMISFDPSNRPTITEILNSEWMKEIINMKEKEEKELEKEVNNILNNLYDELQKDNIEISIASELEKEGYSVRSYENNDNIIFSDNNLKPTLIPNDTLIINNYIIIKGYLNPIDFMNSIISEIKESFKDDGDNETNYNASNENLKVKIIFKRYNNEEKKRSEMQIELFEYEDGRHLLEFLNIKGEFSDYYNNFLKIKEIIRKMFSKK